MFCKQCGKDIPDDSVFCKGCGTRQTGQGAETQPGAPAPFDAAQGQVDAAGEEQDLWEGGRSGKKYIFHYILISVLFVASLAAAWS